MTGDTTTEADAPRPLRVDIVVAGRHGPAWVADAIAAIDAAPHAVLGDLVVEPGPPSPLRGGARRLLGLYDRLDRRLFGRSDDPTRTVDLIAAHARAVRPHRPPIGDADVRLRLDGVRPTATAGPMPRHGIWTIEHGPGLPPRARSNAAAMAPGAMEQLLGWTAIESRLVIDAADGSRVVDRVVSRVDALSVQRAARGHLPKLVGLVVRALAAVSTTNQLPAPREMEPVVGPGARSSTTGLAFVARGLVNVVGGYLARLVRRRLSRERWIVAIARGADADPDAPRSGVRPGAMRTLSAPEGREWADPFPIRTADGDLVFVEEYVWADRRGHLAVVTLDDSPRGWQDVRTILDLPTHLSYPFVFEWEGRWYLLPEQASAGGLQLYVADRFPDTWTWHAEVLDHPAADATLARIGDRWWMFTAHAIPGGTAADELHVYHATSPFGPWTAHVANPVVSDVRTARPAGHCFERDGTWYRVAQDGAATYGHAIVILRIDHLDLTDYRETVVEVIRPDWAPGLTGTHTLNRVDGLVVVDGLLNPPILRR